VRCDFCGNLRARWRYPTDDQGWLACDKCRAAIEADDREALLERVMLAPTPRSVSDRLASPFRVRARQLHEDFWSLRRGPAELL
jgi:hypothetical protein